MLERWSKVRRGRALTIRTVLAGLVGVVLVDCWLLALPYLENSFWWEPTRFKGFQEASKGFWDGRVFEGVMELAEFKHFASTHISHTDEKRCGIKINPFTEAATVTFSHRLFGKIRFKDSNILKVQ